MVNLQLIPANEQDMPQIRSMAEKIWNVHYPPVIGQAQVDYMLQKMYDPESLRKQMQEGQQFYLIQENGQTCGFVSLSDKGNGHYFIHKFYIDTDLHGKGLGTRVFEEIQRLYPAATQFFLQVNRQNHKPINFYFKLGFVIEKVADFDIGDGYFMNDFVMVWRK